MEKLQARAELLKNIRQWFDSNYALEVFTPSISQYANTDPNLDSFEIKGSMSSKFLNTSPEFYIKQLLSKGVVDCYQVARVYRDGEIGRFHQPEFDLLEWYRMGWDEFQLMQEVEDLIGKLFIKKHPTKKANYYSYTELFNMHFDIDPKTITLDQCITICDKHDLDFPKQCVQDRDINAFLDLILSQIITITFKKDRLTFIYHYPANQSSLAKCKNTKEGLVAQRFECYWGSMELANGFNELQDVKEQQQRFEQENQQRSKQSKPTLPIDKDLITALEKGIPQCSGVALGIERLHMAYTSAKHINEVCCFPQNN